MSWHMGSGGEVPPPPTPHPCNTHTHLPLQSYLYADYTSLEGWALSDPQRGVGRKGSGLEWESGDKASITHLL